MERIMIDLIDMTRYKRFNDGYCWILTILDVYSKFAWAFPLKSKTGDEVTKNLKFLFYDMTGPPKILQSDNGKKFCNSYINKLCSDFFIVQKHSRPRHPQSNGQIERFNQTLTRTIQKHVFEESLLAVDHSKTEEEKEWLKHLDKVVYNYNLAKHSATKQVPFNLFLRIPGFNSVYTQDENESSDDSLKEIEMILKTKNKRDLSNSVFNEQTETGSVDPNYLARMDRHSLVHISKYTFEIGDKVIVAKDFDNNIKTKKLKLSSFFSKEVKIIEILSNNRVKCETEEGTQIFPMSRLKKL